jgi:aldehyde dehydrogenase (NAD+)
MDFLKQLGIKDHNSGSWYGHWSDTTDQGVIESINSSNGKVIASVYSSSATDYQHVIQSAQQAAAEWRKVPAPQRGEAVRLVTNALRDYKDALGSLVSLEMGKIKPEGDGEVQEMIDIGDLALGQSRMMYGKTMHSERPVHRMYEQWHPLGVVGVITAFNFPVAVWAWNAMLSAICGNATIWKPSPKGVLCCVAVQNIVNEALGDSYPPIFSSIMEAGNTHAKAMVDDRRINLISFTGSSEVGLQVGAKVAARAGKSLLELGGNNAMIIDATADLKLAVPAVVFGAVGTAGQRCTSTRRLFVHNSIIDEVSKTLTDAYQQVRIGDPLDANTLMGPMTDEAAVERYLAAVEQAQQAGGKLLTGGERLDGDGFYVTPALIRAENHWDIVQQETFAPILYVIGFDELEDAIAMQNDVRQGLSSAIFTRDLQNAELFLSANGSDCGIANVNIGTSGAEIGGAFGGEKETGGGRESGSDAWQNYMRRQTNTINWSSEMPLAQGIKFEL